MTILEEENKSNSSPISTGGSPKLNGSSGSTPSPVNLKTTTNSVITENNNQTQQNPASQQKNHILSSMISNVADRYITPEYLAPLPASVRTYKKYLKFEDIAFFDKNDF